nr:Gfo/Idh/MocA family oxidoreductase [uncultured Agathobaculum sp.]
MRIGTIGTGGIVTWVMREAVRMHGVTFEAVYSRAEDTGRALADAFGVQKVYTSLDDMLADPSVDWVYVASPNSLHYAQTKKALQAGKHVLCEKPFTPSRAQAEELAALAEARGLMLLEGITTLYLPHFARIRDAIRQIGPVRQVSCTFCQYSSKFKAFQAGQTPNVFQPAFAGGALMDINLYNLYFVYGLFGMPERITYHARRHENGIDLGGVAVLEYPGFLAQCTGAKDCRSDTGAHIIGENGFIRVEDPVSMCTRVSVVTDAGEIVFDEQKGENAWYWEMKQISALAVLGNREACRHRMAQSADVMELLQRARQSAGIVFPGVDG